MYEDANYYYQEGQKEVNKTQKKKKPISIMDMALFLYLLDQANYTGLNFKQCIESTIQYNVQQLYRQILINIQQQKELEIENDEFQNIINKQQNTKLSINGDKISGFMDTQMIGLNNKSKVEGIKQNDSNAKVRFIAVIDGKETDMCRSLDNKVFYIDKENKFDRYYGETQNELRMQRIRCKGLVLGLNLPPISHHFHWCRSYIIYLPVEKGNKTEYNIPNYLKTKIVKSYKNALNDMQIIQKEYDMLPENVKNRLEKENVTIILNDNKQNSGYNPKTKQVILQPNLENGEFIHEIGHALYYNLNISQYNTYQNIIDKILDKATIKEFKDKTIPYFGLETQYNMASNYQTFLGYDELTAQLRLAQKNLIEVMSEAYREYYFGKNQSFKLNELVEEVEKNA